MSEASEQYERRRTWLIKQAIEALTSDIPETIARDNYPGLYGAQTVMVRAALRDLRKAVQPPCPECHGEGYVPTIDGAEDYCPVCKGKGYAPQ